MEPRVQRRLVFGLIPVDPALAEYHHRQVHRDEEHDDQAAGHLGETLHVQNPERDHHRPTGEQDGGHRRVKRAVHLAQHVRQQAVPRHGEGKARSRQQARVGHGCHGHDAENRRTGRYPASADAVRQRVDRVEILSQLRVGNDADQRERQQRIQHHHEAQGPQHAQRNVACGVLHLFCDGRHFGDSVVGNEHEARRSQQTARSVNQSAGQVLALDISHSERDQPHERDDGDEHDCGLGASDLLHPQDVQHHDADQQDRRRGLDRQAAEGNQVGSEADQGEGALHQHAEPQRHAGDGSRQGPKDAVDVHVGAAGRGHGGGQLGLAGSRREHAQTRQHVGSPNARPRLGSRQARQHEQPAAQHGAQADRDDADRPQAAL